MLDVVLEGQSATHSSILKEYQRDPIRGHVSHIDLLEVRLDVAIQATVNVHLHGAEDAPGVKEGGVLSQPSSTLNVEALPMEVPESIEADVSRMEMGDALRLEDLPKLEGVTFLDDLHETVIATVSAPQRRGRARARERGRAEGEEGEAEALEGERRARPVAEGEALPSGDAQLARATQATAAARVRLSRLSRAALDAPLPSGRQRLDARSPRRWARQPGPRACARPAQRRLDGRRRAGAAARRLVQVEVLRPARRDPRSTA